MHEQLLDNEAEIRSNYNHIEFLAYHDMLTNLPNKLCFLERIDTLLAEEGESDKKHAIYFVDLDNFKTINDTLGHDYGDETLSATGQRLTQLINEQDIVARVGGDEFLLFKHNIHSEAEALQFAKKLLSAFEKPFSVRNETIHVTLSIGISIYPLHGTSHKALIKNADIAMYHSKESGKNRVSLFDEAMSETLNRNTKILDVLHSAIENKEIYLMYQPQVDTHTRKIAGYEALLRIESQTMGFLPPGEFVPLAEESGLIVSLGNWALKEACLFNKSLLDSGITPCPVSVNISSIQLNSSSFVDTVRNILEETGLPPQYLALEITETALIASFSRAIKALALFQSMGIHIFLDDFGTGYSSLKYLTTMPIDTLKIDKSFVDNICDSEKDSLIIKAITSLARELRIRVIAEGVEHSSQYELLKTQYCDMIQGFLFSRPIDAATLTEHLKNDDIL